jgi:tetratricopeptide (TPR) repeat protein
MLLGLAHVCGQDPTASAKTPAELRDNAGLEALLQETRAALDGGKLEEAEHDVHQYLSARPNSAEGHYLLGSIFFRMNKPQASLAEFTEAARTRDPGPFDLKLVALDYVLLGKFSEADTWLTKSLKGDPRDSQSWYYLGRTKYNEGRLEEAIRAFEHCLELLPHDVKAETNLGLSYEGLGRTEEALAAYKKAINWQSQLLNPNPTPLIEIGRFLLEHDRTTDALSYLQKAASAGPQDFRTHEQLGKVYSRLNNLPSAQAEFEKAVGLAPNSASLHFMLGQVYRKRGMTEKARTELNLGATLQSSSPPLTPPPLE